VDMNSTRSPVPLSKRTADRQTVPGSSIIDPAFSRRRQESVVGRHNKPFHIAALNWLSSSDRSSTCPSYSSTVLLTRWTVSRPRLVRADSNPLRQSQSTTNDPGTNEISLMKKGLSPSPRARRYRESRGRDRPRKST
jgi:hypothetical protein